VRGGLRPGDVAQHRAGAGALRSLQVVRLDSPDQRDRARALIGVARRHTVVVFLRPVMVGVAAAGAVLLMLVATGLAL
jgi:hypothetical protein